MALIRDKLLTMGIAGSFAIVRNEVNPRIGNGDILLQFGERQLLAWVREEPEAAGKEKISGFLVVDSIDAVISTEDKDVRPFLRQPGGKTVQFVARVLEILQVQSIPSRPNPHYWLAGECGGIALTFSLNSPYVETIAVGDLIRGSGILEFSVF